MSQMKPVLSYDHIFLCHSHLVIWHLFNAFIYPSKEFVATKSDYYDYIWITKLCHIMKHLKTKANAIKYFHNNTPLRHWPFNCTHLYDFSFLHCINQITHQKLASFVIQFFDMIFQCSLRYGTNFPGRFFFSCTNMIEFLTLCL